MRQERLYLARPGFHSHNVSRRSSEGALSMHPGAAKFRTVLLVLGFGCLGYCACTLADQQVYQTYENWAFDQQISGRAKVTFRDYVREQTPFSFLAAIGESTDAPPPNAPAGLTPLRSETRPANGSVMGRVVIERLNLWAVVRQGVDDRTLREAVGHVPSTALPGESGNFAIAAHRDTLFRALKDIQKGDLVTFQSTAGLFTYQVVATKIVLPTDVSVLQPDGGGLISDPDKLLTMITCYPFYYVGSAPKRFVVEAKLVTT